MIPFADLECGFLTYIMPYNLLAVTNAWRTLLLLLLLLLSNQSSNELLQF